MAASGLPVKAGLLSIAAMFVVTTTATTTAVSTGALRPGTASLGCVDWSCHSGLGCMPDDHYQQFQLIDYDYQGDSPKEEDTSSSQEACPSVPRSYPQSACQQSQCKTDQDCKSKKQNRCCFNGCIYTCAHAIDEPVLIDWRVAPRRIVKSAPYWLIRDSDNTPDEYQSCSTTKVLDDEDPLLCPDGYVCHIVTPENSEQNIPNRGWCVKEKDDRNHMKDYEQRELKTKHIDPTSCYEESIVFLNGASVHYKGKWCNCVEGKLICKRKHRN